MTILTSERQIRYEHVTRNFSSLWLLNNRPISTIMSAGLEGDRNFTRSQLVTTISTGRTCLGRASGWYVGIQAKSIAPMHSFRSLEEGSRLAYIVLQGNTQYTGANLYSILRPFKGWRSATIFSTVTPWLCFLSQTVVNLRQQAAFYLPCSF